jgi:hypothetical protein
LAAILIAAAGIRVRRRVQFEREAQVSRGPQRSRCARQAIGSGFGLRLIGSSAETVAISGRPGTIAVVYNRRNGERQGER